MSKGFVICEIGHEVTSYKFYCPIKRNNLSTFTSLYEVGMKYKFATTNHCIRWGLHVDLRRICQHALLPVPGVTLSEMKIGMVLAGTITANIDCPNKIDCEGTMCIIIDGHALVHSIGKPAEAKTLGDLGDTFSEAVIHLGQSYKIIVIIFDRYRRESIKSAKHKQNSPNKEGHRRPACTLTSQLGQFSVK